ncbi:sensor histidine kinase [Streptomyces sp. NRRL WC-3742]|uniref:sensor histidine kinase n=1 Tax=Streptomyces sp. NRRL WC-3742 TaxID=1463934 RepID=UPI00068C4B4C|nr:histidine kinase [Streptomyces sp. NRRL WC-3742]
MSRPAPARRRRWLRSTRLQDAALALAVIVPEAFFFGAPVTPGADTRSRLELVAFCLPEFLALLYRRRWTVPAFAVVWTVAVSADLVTAITDFEFTPYFGMLVALYTVARQRGRAAALAALAFALVPAGLAIRYTVEHLASPGHRTAALIAGIAFYLPVTAAAWGIGVWSRAVAEAAARDRRELARARRAVAHERTRIARELHDIVANAVAVMVMQAEATRSTACVQPARTDASLARIEEVGRAAMAELRRLLRLLRTAESSLEQDEQRDEQRETEPDTARRGLADLATLLEDVRRAGVAVDLEVSGTPAHLDDSLDLTAYRLLQEAVTNVTKHAGPGSRAVVRIDWSEVLRLEVVDDGAGRSRRSAARGLSTGHGLLGLAERVALFGGELSAAPYRSGFRVTATLPLTPVSPSSTHTGEER